jgi:LacI family transcriptional regulator
MESSLQHTLSITPIQAPCGTWEHRPRHPLRSNPVLYLNAITHLPEQYSLNCASTSNRQSIPIENACYHLLNAVGWCRGNEERRDGNALKTPATLSDVARHANVSTATASRVLSGSSYPVSTETRERVQRSALELGYAAHALARALVTKQSQTIGVIVGDMIDPYFAEIASGVEEFARSAGCLTIICKGDRSPTRERAYLRLLKGHRAGGVVFAGGTYVDSLEMDALRSDVVQAVAEGMRVVDLGERGFAGIPVITVDNRAVLSDMTTYLVSLGHRSIAFLEGPPGFSTSKIRLQGYLDAMREAELAPTLIDGCGFDFESGRAATLRLLAGSLPDAIIAFSDESALGVLMALRQAGIDVPGRISVAGVDGSRDAALLDLTTVKLPMYELGAAAARLVVEAEDTLPLTRAILPHRVVSRGTTAHSHLPSHVPVGAALYDSWS